MCLIVLLSWRFYFSDEIDVAFPLLDVWRTFRRNSVGGVSFPPLRRIQNWRRQAHFQHITPVLQQAADWEVLQADDRKQTSGACKNMCTVHPTLLLFQWTYISTKHVVRLPDSDSIEPNRCNSVNAVKDQLHLPTGSVDENPGESGRGNGKYF